MSRVSEAIGIVKGVLEDNHPSADVKSAESGKSDFRVSAVGASISVKAYDGVFMTDDDIEEVVERADSELDDRRLEYRKEDEDKVWFDLKS